MTLIDQPFIAISNKDFDYSWDDIKKRRFKQSDEVIRVYYSKDMSNFFCHIDVEDSQISFHGNIREVCDLIFEGFNGATMHAQVVFPRNWHNEHRIVKPTLAIGSDAKKSMMTNLALLIE